MSYPWLIPLITAVVTLALGILVNQKGPRTELSQVFTFLAATLVFWNLNFFVLYSVSDRHLAFSLSRVFRSGVMFMSPAILHVCVALVNRAPRVWRKVLPLDYALGGLLIIANSLDLLIADVREVPWGYASVGTGFYNLFVIHAVLNCAAALVVLVHGYRTSTEPRMRLQLKFWLAGALIALPIGQTNLLPAYGIPIYPLGHLGNAVWAGIVAYAIIRHRLMDIDLVVTKGMAYAAVSLVLIVPAFFGVLALQRFSFGKIHPDFSFAVLVILLAVGVLFPVLRRRAESRLQRSLFPKKLEHRSALTAFTRSIVRILDRERLIRELAATLMETLGLDRIAIALADEGKHVLSIRYALGPPAATQDFSPDDALITSLNQRQGAVLRDELEASTDAAERTVVASVCRQNGWEVCIPLAGGGKLMGFLALGRKRNLNPFFSEDLDLLETLAAEASVALENARLYEELKRSQDIIRRADRLSALGTLAAGIAHEVRNPLVSIQTFFQLAPHRLHDEEFFTTFLGMTASEVQRISDLITELLSFARSPTRSPKPLNLNDAVDRVVTLLEPEARKNKLTIERALSPQAPIVSADADQMKQVLINLVLNAIQATPPGGSVSIISRPMTHHDVPFGQLEIRDTGSGIPQDRLNDIFNPFFTTKEKGTGLGLAIAHQIIAEHGGFIAVESTEGRGTSFFVNLPASEPATASEDSIAEPTEPEVLPHRFDRVRKVAS